MGERATSLDELSPQAGSGALTGGGTSGQDRKRLCHLRQFLPSKHSPVPRVSTIESNEARSVDIVMVDIVRAGGVSQWMKIAGMAEAFNLPIVSHVMPEILVHLVAAAPNGLTVEYMPWMLALYEETPAIENGMLILPDKPGLGLKFDEDAVKAFTV